VRTSPLRRSGVDHTVLPANTQHLPLPCSLPEGTTTEWTVTAPADEAYYSLIDPMRMKGWDGLVGWPTADVYPYKWLPISCRSDADQWKFAGQRLTFYHWATQPTNMYNVRSFSLILTETFAENISCSFSKVRKWRWHWHVVQPKSNGTGFNWLNWKYIIQSMCVSVCTYMYPCLVLIIFKMQPLCSPT